MKLRAYLLIVVVIALSSCTKAQQVISKPPFKIVGYYSLQAAMTDNLTPIPFDKLTHVH